MYKCKYTFIGVAALIAACNSSSLEPPPLAAAQAADRIVSVYLEAQGQTGFVPTFVDRVISASPQSLVAVNRAEGQLKFQGIDTRIIGESCDQLWNKYSQMSSCKEVTSTEARYGDIEATAVTDQEGFAAFFLQQQQSYRVNVKSHPTVEDPKCFWGGSATLEENQSTVGIPMVVFCE